jgi:hypothetical protein
LIERYTTDSKLLGAEQREELDKKGENKFVRAEMGVPLDAVSTGPVTQGFSPLAAGSVPLTIILSGMPIKWCKSTEHG